jgi:pyruvyl transferase EpsI
VLNETLELFASSDLVVTDRYHGLIFSVLCRKPTVVLPTVDHKLTSALSWFSDVHFVRFVSAVDEAPEQINSFRNIQDRELPKWGDRYFDALPNRLGLTAS